MKWPWQRDKSGPPVSETEVRLAEAAKGRALRSVEAADEKWPEVSKVAESLRQLRRENNFAEALHRSYRLRHRGS